MVVAITRYNEEKVLGYKRQLSHVKGHNRMWFLQEVQQESDGAKHGGFAQREDSAGPSTV